MLQAEFRKNVGRYDPELIVTVIPQEYGDHLAVAVELRRDEDGPYVIGIAVRRHVLAGYTGLRTHVPPREVKRLELSRMVDAALGLASSVPEAPSPETTPGGSDPGPWPVDVLVEGDSTWATYYDVAHAEEWRELGFEVPPEMVAARKVLVPRGRPHRSTTFYREIANAHREFQRRGLSPVKEIARRKREKENTVHQWVHRARELGFLEPSPRSKKSKKNDE